MVEVEISIPVEVSEGKAVPLLQVSEAGGVGDVVEPLAGLVPEEDVGSEGFKVGIPGGEKDVEPAVVVDVPEVCAHWKVGMSQSGTLRDISKGAVSIVTVEMRDRGGMGCPAGILHVVLEGCLEGADEDIEPAVVVVVKEPGCEIESSGARYTQPGSYISECPVGVVPEKPVSAHVGKKEVGIAVVVVISGRRTLAEAVIAHPCLLGDISEGPVPIIPEKLGRVVSLFSAADFTAGLVPDEEIEFSILVEVKPDGALGGSGGIGESGVSGYVGEPDGTAAHRGVVAKERIAHFPLRAQPGAPQDQDVSVPIIIVVGGDAVESSQLAGQAGLGGGIPESQSVLAQEETERSAWVRGRGENIVPTVPVEVLGSHSAAEIKSVNLQLGSNVNKRLEAGSRVSALEIIWRDPKRFGNFLRIPPEGHGGEVEEPLHHLVFRTEAEDLEKVPGSGPGRSGDLMQATAPEREDTALGVMACDAVLHLGLPQGNHGAGLEQKEALGIGNPGACSKGGIDRAAGGLDIPESQVVEGQLGEEAPSLRWREGGL